MRVGAVCVESRRLPESAAKGRDNLREWDEGLGPFLGAELLTRNNSARMLGCRVTDAGLGEVLGSDRAAAGASTCAQGWCGPASSRAVGAGA